MTICNLSEILSLIQPGQCLLGIDPGSVVIGVAIADPSHSIASPLEGIKRKKLAPDLARLSQIIKERNVGGLIIGLPKNMDGSEGPAAQKAKAFAHNVMTRSDPPRPDLPIAFWDERMSTAAVTRLMLEDDMTRHRRDEVVDKMAAAYILQGALDALKGTPP